MAFRRRTSVECLKPSFSIFKLSMKASMKLTGLSCPRILRACRGRALFGFCLGQLRVRSWLLAFLVAGFYCWFPGFVCYDEVGCFSEVFFWAGYFGSGAVWGDFPLDEPNDSLSVNSFVV